MKTKIILQFLLLAGLVFTPGFAQEELQGDYDYEDELSATEPLPTTEPTFPSDSTFGESPTFAQDATAEPTPETPGPEPTMTPGPMEPVDEPSVEESALPGEGGVERTPTTSGITRPGKTADKSLNLKPSGKDAKVNLDFSDVEIRDVVKAISKITKKNFILDDRVRGKITIFSPQPVSVREAYEAFLSALEVKGFAVVQEGTVGKIIPIRDAKSASIQTEGADLPYGASFITRILPIEFINANEISASLKSLVSPNGSITAYGPTNSLIVTDSASNIRRLMKIIAKLDRRGFQEGIEVIPLTYASANEIAKILNQLFKVDEKTAGVPKRRTSRGSQDIEGGQIISKILPDERTNSLIVVANREGVEKLLTVVRRLDHQIQVEEGKGRIHVHYLENADSEEMAATLSALTAAGARRGGSSSTRRTSGSTANPNLASLSGYPGDERATPLSASASKSSPTAVDLFEGDVKIAPDAATNALVISASPQDYEALRPIIQKLDIRRRQVFVEAIILEVNINKALDVGVAAHGAQGVGPNNDPTLFGATLLGGLSSIANPIQSINPITGAAILGFRGKNLELPGIGNIPIYGAVFRALQNDKVINVLSTPNILTTDNKPAEILVGSNVAIPIATTINPQNPGIPITSFDRRDIGISLKVTPQVNESNYVTMDIEQKIENVVGGTTPANQQPEFTKRSANTTVVVENEQTVVIGGLISEQEDEIKNKVPVLGDIPLLGWLFQNKTKTKSRQNLMIFITPTIVADSGDMARISREKDIERQRFNRKNRIDEPAGFRDYGVKKRMHIQRSGGGTSDSGQSRKVSPRSNRSLSSLKPGYEEGTAAYAPGYVIDEESTMNRTAPSTTGSPFEEITPPTSE